MSHLSITKSKHNQLLIAVYLIAFVIITSIIWYAFFANNQAVNAASTTGFDAGNIMSDAVMANKKTMTQSQIQSFLNSKNTCKTSPKSTSILTKKNSTYGYLDSGGKRFKYHLKNGQFICLADQDFNGESAAHIIYKAAQDYSINPQVLIVLLQKENSLITDNWPNYNYQYATATGYACPDSGPNNSANCNSNYFGFKNQIRHAASMFRTLLNGQGINNYPIGNNYIQYNPASSCGGNWVNVKNRATGALYTYTPYQPNKGALTAGYGTAPCGAYGNRNFYLYFTDWFGSPNGYSFSSENLSGKTGSVNSVPSNNLGEYTSSVTYGNTVYTFYYDKVNKNLRISHWNGKAWKDAILDGKGSKVPGATGNDVGQHVEAVLWNGQIQVYYYNSTNGSLRHAWLNKGVWKAEILDGTNNSIGGSTSNIGKHLKAILYKNNLQLYYYDATAKALKHAWWPGDGRWHFEYMDGVKNSLSKKTSDVGSSIDSLVYDKNNLQLYYYDATAKALKHAWWPGDGRWHFEYMDGVKNSLSKKTSDVGSALSATLYKGNIQLYYFDRPNGELVHMWWVSKDEKWHREIMDGNTTNSVFKNYINAGKKVHATQYGNDLVLFYYDDAAPLGGTNSKWRIAIWHLGLWLPASFEDNYIASNVDGGTLSTTKLGKTLQVFYRGPNGTLRHAWTKGY